MTPVWGKSNPRVCGRMKFDIANFRAGFGATMARIRDSLQELSRAQEEMRQRIDSFCAR